MKYNYPLISEEAVKIHKLIAQNPTEGLFVKEFCGIILLILLLFSITFLMTINEWIGTTCVVICIIALIPTSQSILNTLREERSWKTEIMQSASASLENQEEYNIFQNNVMRYLHAYGIDLSQNCSTPAPYNSENFVPNSPYAQDFRIAPLDTIVCNKDKTSLSGTIVFENNNNQEKLFIYKTYVNQDNDYLEFTLKEKA